MKKNFIRYSLMCGLCVLMLYGCYGCFPLEPSKSEEKTRSFVTAFSEPTSFGMELTNNNNILLYWSLNWRPNRWVTFRCIGTNGVRYNELVTRYNDLSYNRVTVFYFLPRMYISNEITSIDVISNRDFDAEHPAGTSLAGFVRLLSVSPIRFIESGYQETFDWHNNYPEDFLRETATFHESIPGHSTTCNGWEPLYPNHFPISGVLSELVANDFRLLGVGGTGLPRNHDDWFFGFLVFDKEPENVGTHRLTVTIHRTNGRVLSQTIEKTFGE